MEKEHHCLECGKPLYGRPDKKFCSSNCKNEWHYQQSAGSIRQKNWTHSLLTRNYKILRELLGNKSKRFSLAELQMRGFSSQMVTSHLGHCKDKQYYACYDILYTQSSTEVFNIHSTAYTSPLP